MSYKIKLVCRNCSLLWAFLLVLQCGNAQYQFKEVDDWLINNLKNLGGRAVLVIYKNGKMIYNNDANHLSRGQKFITKRIARKLNKDADELLQDFDADSKIMIASCSKWLSAALVMSFVDEGKLSLEDSVGKYLPVMTANGKGQITIWQCLSHLTGIKAASGKEGIQEILKAGSMEEAVTILAKKEMEGLPGKTFHYSNAGLQIAAAVIEKISGLDFKTLFRERIAAPCEMMYTDFGDGNVPLAAGGARSTATDYLHFLTMILNNGMYNGKRILSEQSVAAMQVNRVNKDCVIAGIPDEAVGWGYGFGEWVAPICNTGNENKNGPCINEGERSYYAMSPGLFGSFPWIDNNKKYAGFLLSFGLKSKGRSERYKALKALVDEALK